MPKATTSWIAEEFAGAELGDSRRTARLMRLVGALERNPSKSLPKALGNDAEIEGAYRFLNNEAVEFRQLLEPHCRSTAERAGKLPSVLVVHDTTLFQFAHADPREVGYLATGKPGYFGHFSLAVSNDGKRQPLGVVALQTQFRSTRRPRGGGKHRPGSETAKQVDRESRRWEDGVTESDKLLSACAHRIHVGDREADSFRFLVHIVESGSDFVVRIRQDRMARTSDAEEWSKLREIVGEQRARFEREVPLSKRALSRAPGRVRSHPPRKKRMAQLCFATATLELKRPPYFEAPVPPVLKVNVVRVYEPNAPTGIEPVEWLIATTEPIATVGDVERVVDIYRTRWVIEEYFKALKTGCIYQERQLESRHALLNALAVFTPLACHLLWLRSRAHHAPEAPATQVITRQQLTVLRALAPGRLAAHPSARDVLLAIAARGGHLKRNGEPGWASIANGLVRLLGAEEGWVAAMKRNRNM